jgi:hypothetical protein
MEFVGKVFGCTTLRGFVDHVDDCPCQISMFGKGNIFMQPDSVFIEMGNRMQCVPFFIMGEASEISDLFQEMSNRDNSITKIL